MKMLKKSLFCLSILLALQLAVGSTDQLSLRGVTVFKPPFVEKNAAGKLHGFFVDLLDELAAVGKFNYTLENLRQAENSMLQDMFPSLLISDVLNNKADFALSDVLFKKDNYVRYANFTEPYIVSGFSALVQKSLLARDNITNFEELLEKTKELKPKQALPGSLPTTNSTAKKPESDILIGTVASSATFRQLTMGNGPIVRQVYERIAENPTNLVGDLRMGVERVTKQSFALVQETFKNELETDANCGLTHLALKPSASGSAPELLLEYSLAVRKRFTHLTMLNNAMKTIRDNGTLEKLRKKYFKRKCNAVV